MMTQRLTLTHIIPELLIPSCGRRLHCTRRRMQLVVMAAVLALAGAGQGCSFGCHPTNISILVESCGRSELVSTTICEGQCYHTVTDESDCKHTASTLVCFKAWICKGSLCPLIRGQRWHNVNTFSIPLIPSQFSWIILSHIYQIRCKKKKWLLLTGKIDNSG